MSPPHGKVDASAAPNGWNQWGNHVLTELQTLNRRLAELEKGQIKLLVQMEGLKTRASIFGAIGGAAILLIVQFVSRVIVKGV